MYNSNYLKDLKKAGIIKNIPASTRKIRETQKLNYHSIQDNEAIIRSNNKRVSFDINSFFDKIYILNLDHRADRLESMKIKLEKYKVFNYKRFSAINGRKKPFLDYWRNTKRFFDTAGAFGVLMSVYFIIVDAIKNKYKQILILEDDVIFHKDFNNLFNRKIRSIPDDWKLLFLGSSMHKWRYEQRCKIHHDYVIPKGSIPGAFALGIDSECYIPIINQLKKLDSAWDLAPLKFINTIYHNKCFVMKPNIIIADTRDSDIREAKSLEIKSKDCDWKLTEYDI